MSLLIFLNLFSVIIDSIFILISPNYLTSLCNEIKWNFLKYKYLSFLRNDFISKFSDLFAKKKK